MGSQSKQKVGIYFLMLLVPLFWGGAFGAAKHVITEITPITAATLQFGPAGLILLLIVTIRSQWKIEVLKKQWFGLLMMALTGILGYNAFFFVALGYTSAINGSLIMATTPVFVTFGAVLFLNETWNGRLGFGLLLSLIGVFLVIIKGSLETLISLTFNAGDLLFVAGLICWVIHGLIGKVVMKESSPLFTTTITMLLGSFFFAIWSLFEGGWGKVPNMSEQSWIEMLFLIVCSSVVAFLLWNKGIHQIGASKSSLYMNLVPITATWIALLFYGAVITWQQIVGMSMVIIGVYVATISHKISFIHVKKKRVNNTIA
ncbi:DMT family transporter [Priestia filamentosa]|uniref:DMT family transporter n=1 Tax=Priestia filamentosa TaxID=1402861 RepID=UPI000E714E44|nr:DMT family transporter [Priestia filamentosa]RJS63969.1 EamA family transporter [Priestia filamentosa]